jgi:hypothetical protein
MITYGLAGVHAEFLRMVPRRKNSNGIRQQGMMKMKEFGTSRGQCRTPVQIVDAIPRRLLSHSNASWSCDELARTWV